MLLYDTIDEAVELLKKVKSMSAEKKAVLEQKNREFYIAHLSSSAMYDSYMVMLNDIFKKTAR